MIKRIVVLITVVFFIALSNIKISFSETDKEYYLQEIIDSRVSEVTEKRERKNHPFTKCIEKCYENSEKWYRFGEHDCISSMNSCIKNDDCIMCVDSCIDKYESEIDQETLWTYIELSRNLCFINSLI